MFISERYFFYSKLILYGWIMLNPNFKLVSKSLELDKTQILNKWGKQEGQICHSEWIITSLTTKYNVMIIHSFSQYLN